MKSRPNFMRVSLLVLLMSVAGAVTILFARATLPALTPADAFNGLISGQLTGVAGIQMTRPFTISASGVSSGTTYFSSTTANKLSPAYVFSPVGAGDLGGYGPNQKSVTWTVGINPPAPCYIATPASYTAYLDQNNKSATGLNFAVSYQAVPATITVLMTEVVNIGWQPPTGLAISPPEQVASTNNLFNIQYLLTRSDGITMLATTAPVNAPVAVPNLLTSEPPNGSCAWTYTVTVNSIQPYLGSVNWHFVPAGGTAVTVSTGNPAAEVGILAYHYWVFQPILVKP